MAITIVADTIMVELDITLAHAERLLSVASALVNDYCDTCPDAVANESVLRVCGWLFQTPMGSIKSEAAGPLRITYNSEQKNALKHSGAESLLSGWKVRRAMVIA